MAKDLKTLLGAKPATETQAPSTPAKLPEAEAPTNGEATARILDLIAGVDVETVIGGALARVHFKEGTNPAEVGAMLLILDPGAKVRDAFPMKGGGARDVKLARAVVINVRVTDSGKFIDLTCQNGDDLSVSVSRKSSDTFLEQIRALGKLTEKNLAKLEKAFSEKKTATVILSEGERFGVKYWTTDDGKAFVESFQAEPPAEDQAKGDASHD